MTTLLYNPTITSFTPASGPAGTTITVTGTHLLQSTGANALAVTYGNLNANSNNPITYITPATNTATSLSFVVPAKAESAYFDITTDIGPVESVSQFVVTPHVTSYTPTASHVGSFITITGSDLKDSTVTVNGIAASLVVNGYGALMVQIPVGATTGTVVVTTTKNNITTTNTCTPALTIS